jgi:hypothetical protein
MNILAFLEKYACKWIDYSVGFNGFTINLPVVSKSNLTVSNQKTPWPHQRDAVAFFGALDTIENQLVFVTPPFEIRFEGKKVAHIRIHKKCSASLARVFDSVKSHYEHTGLEYSGSYANRNIRGGNSTSMHAFGAAIDFDAENNGLGTAGTFTENSPLVRAFELEGWIWGGRWKTRSDPMHFQAAVI